jgi:hypothetical protein
MVSKSKLVKTTKSKVRPSKFVRQLLECLCVLGDSKTPTTKDLTEALDIFSKLDPFDQDDEVLELWGAIAEPLISRSLDFARAPKVELSASIAQQSNKHRRHEPKVAFSVSSPAWRRHFKSLVDQMAKIVAE